MKKIIGDIVRWGIIGVGNVCEVKSAPAMQRIQGSELIAVMRRNGAMAADYAQRHSVPKWYDDAQELISDEDINAIYIATPPDTHAKYTIEAAESGKPVYVEKPMARTVEECQKMIDVCAQNEVSLYIAYYRRKLPHFEKLKSLVISGAIGEIRSVKIELLKTFQTDIISETISTMPKNWRIDPQVAGGGYFYDLAAHQLDYLDYLFGPIETVHGIAANQSGQYLAADIVQGVFQFRSGVVGLGNWCFTADSSAEKDEISIIGSKGQIKMACFGSPSIQLESSHAESTQIYDFELPKHIQQPLIQTIVDDLLGKGECPSLGRTAIRTNWVMQEMTKNFYH